MDRQRARRRASVLLQLREFCEMSEYEDDLEYDGGEVWNKEDDALKVYVSKLPLSTDDQTLESAFAARFGEVTEARVVMGLDEETNEPVSKRFGQCGLDVTVVFSYRRGPLIR